ncbi:MAG TPA: CAP domain-containing protein [Verrucomicrobiae bacterium]|nr:CAP domain-containing protein [Verrucomicrobiae bacterium]
MFSKLRFGLLLILISFAGTVSYSPSTISADQLLNLVNQDRAAHGLPTLTMNSTLNLAALAKAQDMLKNNYFDHVSPNGLKPWHFFKVLGYNYVYAGENLALNFTDASELENSWMNSPKHRENILSPYYSELGLAVVNQNNRTVIVQFFGSKDALLTYEQ